MRTECCLPHSSKGWESKSKAPESMGIWWWHRTHEKEAKVKMSSPVKNPLPWQQAHSGCCIFSLHMNAGPSWPKHLPLRIHLTPLPWALRIQFFALKRWFCDKSPYCSCRRPGSQHLLGNSQTPATPFSGVRTPSSAFHQHSAWIWYTDVHADKTPIYINKNE